MPKDKPKEREISVEYQDEILEIFDKDLAGWYIRDLLTLSSSTQQSKRGTVPNASMQSCLIYVKHKTEPRAKLV